MKPDTAALWICTEVLRQLNYRSIEFNESKLDEKILAELFQLVESKTITESVGKKLLERIIDSGESPNDIVKKESLGKISEESQLSAVADEVLKENQQAVADYKSGRQEALNFLMGKVMKRMKGRADFNITMKLLQDKIG